MAGSAAIGLAANAAMKTIPDLALETLDIMAVKRCDPDVISTRAPMRSHLGRSKTQFQGCRISAGRASSSLKKG
jgi:hypothetical protein